MILRVAPDASRATGARRAMQAALRQHPGRVPVRRPPSSTIAAVNAEDTKRRLNVILVLAVVDAVLLVPLLLHRFNDLDVPTMPIGMTHGLLFIALVGLCAKGALDGLWGWWFPAITVVTGGPPGSIIGDLVLRRRLAAS